MSIIRQQYTEPVSGKKQVREFYLDVEILRPDSSEDTSSEINLKAGPHGHEEFCNHISINPNEVVCELIDGKRTYKPQNCYMSRLSRLIEKGSNVLILNDTNREGLKVEKGDPIVLLKSLDDSDPTYAIVLDINKNQITISQELEDAYYQGSIVQNLANRWWKGSNIVGCKSQITRPSVANFVVNSSNGNIDIILGTPINLGVLKTYDIYVRDQNYEKIEPHWMPDMLDLDAIENSVIINTYNGGEKAGGGKLKPGVQYYVSVISKDKKGFVNVNESECLVEVIKV